MIHIATVHYQTANWIDIQLRYLHKTIMDEFRVYAFVDFRDSGHAGKFFHCYTHQIQSHPMKLNLLADKILHLSEDNSEILIFLDGDAFPIGALSSYLMEKLARYPLIAIQRLENNGDLQPHPAFCATTTGFWREMKADWNSGHTWENASGDVITDPGGNLLKLLVDREIEWFPMLRSNRRNLHPLWFGLYDGMVYHHGAGFRDALSRIDKHNHGIPVGIDHDVAPKDQVEYRHKKRSIILRNNELSSQIYEQILHDEEFHKQFV